MFFFLSLLSFASEGFPKGDNSTSAQGNYLEAINLSFNGKDATPRERASYLLPHGYKLLFIDVQRPRLFEGAPSRLPPRLTESNNL